MADVVWLAPGYPWADEPALGVFYQTQARALARLGVALTVISPTPWAPWPLRAMRPGWRHYADAPKLESDRGVIVVRPRYPNVPGEPSRAMPDRFVADAAWRSRAHWAGAGLIHGHHSITGLAAWRLARRSGLPFMLTFHGSDMNVWPDEKPERLPDLRAAVRDAGAVIAVSRALAERVRSVVGVDAVALPIGCDHRSLGASTVPRELAREALGVAEDVIVVLFVGRLERAKGIRELATAILRLGDPFRAVFVGDGPEAGFGADDADARRRLVYVGTRPNEDVVRFLSAADVFVLPSYREGLPTVLVEAGSVGVPVIATAVGGVPELLGPDRGALLPEATADAVISALTRFRGDRAGAAAAATRLRAHVLERYDADRNAARLFECYRLVAGGTHVTREWWT